MLELQYLFDADRDEESYFSSIEGKTASLMATACRIGGMVSDVSADTLDALTQFGHHLGMCFQIVDDVLDVTASVAELGKPAGNDVHEGVYTLPVIYALRVVAASCASCSAASSNWPEVEKVVALVADARRRSTRRSPSRARTRPRRTRRWPARPSSTPPCANALRTLVDGLVLRSS